MRDELTELLDTAIYREIASYAFYTAGQKLTADPGARAVLKELAHQELKHSQWLKELKEKGVQRNRWSGGEIADLKISDYLTGRDSLDNSGIQDVLVFAMKREQQSLEFYSRMSAAARDEALKTLCERLVHEEMKHKLRLETTYDDLFYQED